MTVSEILLVCSVYKLIPWFVFESSIQIKRSDPADLDTDWGKKGHCGSHQALQQSPEFPCWWKIYSVATKHSSFQANLISTAPTRYVVLTAKVS